MLKRKLLFAAAFLFIAWAATSCEAISGCKICNVVTYENNLVINTGPDKEYCGTELVNEEKIAPITVGAQTIKVECH